MATCSEVITGALYELGAVQLGETAGNEEVARGMVVLQSLYREAVDKGVFGRVEEYLATANYTAEEQQRVYSAGFTITIPTTIEDDDTGEDRRPKDLAMIQVVNASTDPQVSVYDAHVAAWVRLDGLASSDEAPFSKRARQGLECAVAARLASSVSSGVIQPSAMVMSYAAGLAKVLGQKMSSPRAETSTSYF